MDDLCPCGIPADFDKVRHMYLTCHECIHHSPKCRVCFTIRQVETYLAGFPARKTGEAA
jgi:hypothetical protein